ncbi:MAG: OmpH family outer membrane protein [Candidatus Eisenbacteria bacterium]|uniref:OmpH family outer membrane protein n=1 Tax=Eiseniibacteriota bacterium TaxID=2212470 RepID=A0A849SXV1_UNCEI|nr:OmpH family outer membrane protein [Candidatus Eisenbacteria bacterium]
MVRRLGIRLALLAALLLVSVGVQPAHAASGDLRVGFIDSARIFRDFKLAQEAQQRFDRQIQAWQDEAAEKQKAVEKLRTEVREQSPILSTARRQERDEALQKAVSEYEAFVQDIWGPQGRAAQENEQSTREIVRQIREVVEKLATDQALTLVLDTSSGIILFADRSLDLTNAVLVELATRTSTSAPN